MSRILFVAIARLYVVLTLGTLLGLTVVYVVVDFGDKLQIFLNHPVAAVARLYWFKSLQVAYQMAPASLLLAGGTTVSILRRRNEWLAMQAVGASRWVMVLPIAVPALVMAMGLVVFDELVVTNAGTRVDRVMAETFNRWGKARFYYTPKQWFRVGEHVFHVRGETDDDGTIHDVTVFLVGRRFQLEERIDAAVMKNVGGAQWALTSVVSRTFLEKGESTRLAEQTSQRTFAGTSNDTFRVRVGKPELMRVRDILEQQEIRAKVGLPTHQFLLALHNRFAYPMTGLAAAMLAVGLALRPGRRGHLTLAIVEGLLVAVSLFALTMVTKSLALKEQMPAIAAAWAPVAGLLVLTAVLWLRDERRWVFKRAPHVPG